jgi:LacI family transcriptional regulator
MDYARQHGDWELQHLPRGFSGSNRDLWDFKADGALAAVNWDEEAELICRGEMPVVAVGFAPVRLGLIPRVLPDDVASGRLAAAHFLERGFRHLAYVGKNYRHEYELRHKGFFEAAAAAGVQVATFTTELAFASWQESNAVRDRLGAWLRALRHPLGVLASDEHDSRLVLDASHAVGLRVPDDIAVLGIGNNVQVWEHCVPPLSNIEVPSYETGYEAAALLDRLMAGDKVPARDVLLPPKGVVQRRSTDVVAIENADVRAAAEYVRAHVDEAFGVERLAELVGISRRWMENRFRTALGCTPREYILRTRVAKARELLASDPKKKLQDVAAECGFTDCRRMRIVFEQQTGIQPAAYRRKMLEEGKRR